MEKYSSGSRGSPAKGLGWIKPVRGFESLLLRQFVRLSEDSLFLL